LYPDVPGAWHSVFAASSPAPQEAVCLDRSSGMRPECRVAQAMLHAGTVGVGWLT
jgi:hypothetical protein